MIIKVGIILKRGIILNLKRNKTVFLFIMPALIWIGAVMIYPVGYALKLSFSGWSMSKGPESNVFVGFSNYLLAFKDQVLGTALVNTFWYVLFSILSTFIFGLAVALLLNQDFKFSGLLRSFTLVPLMLAPIVAGLIWKYILMARFGIANYLLGTIGVGPFAWLYDPLMAFISVMLIQVWQTTPMSIIILLAGLQGIPIEVLDAAMVDGAVGWQRLWHIILPLLKPVILVNLLLQTIGSYRIFDQIYVTTQGGPSHYTESISTYIVKTGINYTEIGQAAAFGIISLVLIAPIVCLYVWVLIKK